MNDMELRAEEMLRDMGQAMYRQRLENFDRIDKEVQFNKKGEQRKIRYRKLCTVAAVLCIVMISFAALTVTSDAFRGKVFDFMVIEKNEYCDFISKNKAAAQGLTVRYPQYLPDGYVKTDEDKLEDMNIQTYKNQGTGEYLFITQMKDEGMTLSVDNEYAAREKCFIGIYEAYYICDEDSSMLIWDEDGIYFEIASSLDKDTMIRIAEAM